METKQTKEIKLTKGMYALVDIDDYERLNKFKWQTQVNYKTNYAITSIGPKAKRTTLRMHRLILGVKSNQIVDHINGNGLDNRKINLRMTTEKNNHFNRRIGTNNTSGYKGVSYYKAKQAWIAYIGAECKLIHLGYYKNKEEAAKAYNKAAIKYHGEFASPNSI
jgi:hypothetical protein